MAAGSTGVARALSWLGIGLVAALVALLVFVALAPRLLGWHFVVVAGGSMEPTVRLGSLAVMQDVDATTIKAGDVIEFEDPAQPGRIVTHRVTRVSDDGKLLTTKGDANGVEDVAPVPLGAVKARYMFSVPAAGRLIRWMGTRSGYISVILVPGLGIIALEVWSIGRELRKLRMDRWREVASGATTSLPVDVPGPGILAERERESEAQRYGPGDAYPEAASIQAPAASRPAKIAALGFLLMLLGGAAVASRNR